MPSFALRFFFCLGWVGYLLTSTNGIAQSRPGDRNQSSSPARPPAGEQLLGEVGTDLHGGRLFVATARPWCNDGSADVTMRTFEAARVSKAQALQRAALAAQGLQGPALDRAAGRGFEAARKQMMQDAVALIEPRCPELKRIRFSYAFGRDAQRMRMCARAERGWIIEPGNCDQASERNENAMTRFAIDGVLAAEADVRGWSEVQASSAASAMMSMRTLDVNAFFPGVNARTRLPPMPVVDPFLPERLIAERRYEEALRLLQPNSRGRPQVSPEQRDPTLIAAALEGLGRPAEAAMVLQEVIARGNGIERAQLSPIRALLRLGTLYERGGRFEDAAAVYDRGLDMVRAAQARPDSPPQDINSERSLLMRNALLLQKQARADVAHRDSLAERADTLFRRALETSYRQVAVMHDVPVPADPLAAYERDAWKLEHLWIALTGAAWARLAHDRGDDVLARRLAIPAQRALSQLPYETPALAEIAVLIASLDGDLAGFNRALALVESVFGPDDPALAFARTEHAGALLAIGRTEQALDAARQATSLLLRRTERISGDQGLDARTELADAERAFDTHLQAAWRLAEAEPGRAAALSAESFLLAQRLQQTAAGQALARSMGRLASGSDAAARLLRERQDLVERWAALDRQALAAALQPPAQRQGLERRQSDIHALATRQGELDAELRRVAPGIAELARPRVLEIAQVRSLLSPQEATVLFHVGSKDSFVWAVTSDESAWQRIPLGAAALDRMVVELRAGLAHGGESPGTFEPAPAHALYRALFDKVETKLRDRPRWLLVPDGALQSLPFAVLVTTPPPALDPPEVYRRTDWLIRRHSLLTLPSLSSLELRRLTVPPGQEPFLGLGDPLLNGSGNGARGALGPATDLQGVADVAAIRRMDRLRESADEIRALARAAGADGGPESILLGVDATETRLRMLDRSGALERRRIIAFATHGLLAGRVAGIAEPALVLTPPTVGSTEDDGLLAASEIAGLRLNADWVILSACNTAAEGQPGAESLSGLARAFLHAGARSLLVSHWPVASNAAVALTTASLDAIRADQGGMTRQEALQRAMLALIDGPAAENTDPWRWAPFVVVGGKD